MGTGPPAADWAMVTVRLAIVTVALRAGPEFAPTEMRIVALPAPLAGVRSPSQLALLEAVQAHPSVAESVTVMSPPELPTSCRRDAMSYTHGAASCTISTRLSETTTAPRRCRPIAFGETE